MCIDYTSERFPPTSLAEKGFIVTDFKLFFLGEFVIIQYPAVTQDIVFDYS